PATASTSAGRHLHLPSIELALQCFQELTAEALNKADVRNSHLYGEHVAVGCNIPREYFDRNRAVDLGETRQLPQNQLLHLFDRHARIYRKLHIHAYVSVRESPVYQTPRQQVSIRNDDPRALIGQQGARPYTDLHDLPFFIGEFNIVAQFKGLLKNKYNSRNKVIDDILQAKPYPNTKCADDHRELVDAESKDTYPDQKAHNDNKQPK